ncbi:ATP-dependent Clp protease ATP-binding subunit [Peptacetobacter hominis]|uniref:ATP-dependent Clp protease ATP-binding subunit n=1 Tax=Peptacetobacter hominis TaxID=2743610 RepID=A0A544QWQ6_9FIRM|nr:AAA family ATPase [Peptacetobacter hominis]TQQ85114.1 ATP-dependent Clp protease ATP-binding subunit [Peptacetobacter hominis]
MSKLFFYTRDQFFNFKSDQMSAGFEFLSMSKLISSQKIESLEVSQQYYVDISSIVSFVKYDDSQLFNFEQLFNSFGENISFICDKVYEKDIKYIFRYIFDEFSDVEVERDEITDEVQEISVKESSSVKKITDLDDAELDLFFSKFDEGLYGHECFKEEFKELVTSFRVFNKLGEHKILSLFLMGDSGIGKTEVARTIHKALGSQSKLAKISFGNYSSHDALNSLIGSPRGYIGSDGGELLKRVNESDVGLILIDEFEKANNAVFNYFLDILENGKIINSQADEYDANGYIIVFTSNITKENFTSKISPELRSRFDYKGVFNLLTDEDKKKFVRFRVNQIITKYYQLISEDVPDKLYDTIISEINVSQFKNMRDLNKKIKDTFVANIKP